MGQERETSFSYSRESRVSSRESISKFEEKGRGGGVADKRRIFHR